MRVRVPSSPLHGGVAQRSEHRSNFCGACRLRVSHVAGAYEAASSISNGIILLSSSWPGVHVTLVYWSGELLLRSVLSFDRSPMSLPSRTPCRRAATGRSRRSGRSPDLPDVRGRYCTYGYRVQALRIESSCACQMGSCVPPGSGEGASADPGTCLTMELLVRLFRNPIHAGTGAHRPDYN